MQIRQRVERLEQHDAPETSLMVIIGEPTADQQAILDTGKVRLVIQMPDNERGDNGREQR